MYYEVATRLAVSTSGASDTFFSDALEMGSANAAYVTACVFQISGGSVNVTLQEGNDEDNWSDITTAGGTIGFSATGYGTMKVSSIAARYVRVKYTMFTAGKNATLSAGVNTAQL